MPSSTNKNSIKSAGLAPGASRRLLTGVIENLVIVAFRKGARFAVELRTDLGKHRVVRLPRSTVETQFLFQRGRRVTLPVKRVGKVWRLRLDAKAIRFMREAGVYDRSQPPSAYYQRGQRSSVSDDSSVWVNGKYWG